MRRKLKGLLGRVLRQFLMIFHTFYLYRTYKWVFAPHIEAWKPDIVHAHDGVTWPAGATVAKSIGAKLVLDSHELEAHRSPPLSWFRKIQVERMEQTYLPQADRVVTVSERAADYLANTYGIERPVVTFNAPPVLRTELPERWNVYDRMDVRQDLQLNPRSFLFVYTGNITLNRGIELVIIALSRLQGFKDPNERFRKSYHLALVGKIQGALDQSIYRIAAAYGIEDQVHILPPVAPNRVADYISSANISIIPILPVTLSYEYTMPNKLFEATFSGNPILCSDATEMGPFVLDHGLGETYVADSPEDCATKMIEMVSRYHEYERGQERQRELEKAYGWEAQERKLLDVYKEILGDEFPDVPPQRT